MSWYGVRRNGEMERERAEGREVVWGKEEWLD